MKKTSIIILSYNTFQLTKDCIESIRMFTEPDSYELIVIDNGSQDQSVTWLKQQSDVLLITNTENKGFPGGCNQGMRLATSGNDILLLNSDTIVTPKWLVNLQTALYANEDTGVVSCVTNSCSNWQQIEVPYHDFSGLVRFAKQHNVTNPSLWEYRMRLIGFCYLIKGVVFNQVGYLDEAFAPGNFEDDDYSFRVLLSGYKLLLCKDTFIHHYGSASFVKNWNSEEQQKKAKAFNDLLNRNQQYFCQKWNVSPEYAYRYSVGISIEENIKKVLVIGTNIAETMFWLQHQYKKLQIVGITNSYRIYELLNHSFDMLYQYNLDNFASEYKANENEIMIRI